ncbi:hypothetical protein BQ8794_60098 [Mesorhizobium prunaredense]|uniref:Uncharacterized protein n=1 Tax=Mesorhizobium prunaredense TaxID=1631249 RepID=A0A1R3VFS3_9HYPH|nr:hypothetical protein BQ8794_60098 [Mesorhizobium prunaredense]
MPPTALGRKWTDGFKARDPRIVNGQASLLSTLGDREAALPHRKTALPLSKKSGYFVAIS